MSNNACQFGPEKTRLLGKGNSVCVQICPVAGKARLTTCFKVLEEFLMSGQNLIVAAHEANGLFFWEIYRELFVSYGGYLA